MNELPEHVKAKIDKAVLDFMNETGLSVEDLPAISRLLAKISTITGDYVKEALKGNYEDTRTN